MMDLDAWAQVVARLLKPGGKFLLFEGHPLDFVWQVDTDRFILQDRASYFQSGATPERGFPYGAAARNDPSKPVELTSRVWTIGQTVSAVIGAGLKIAHLEECPECFWDQFPEIPADVLNRLPHTFALVAEKI